MFARLKQGVWEVSSPAKLNLTLNVLSKRSDGFHDIHSVMTRIDLFDTIAMSTYDSDTEIRLTVDDRRKRRPGRRLDPVPTDDRNLIVRAIRELQSRFDVQSGAKVQLTKRIPSQAGLGGGSSNAAAAFVLANRMWGLDLDAGELSDIAVGIGSDIPFFLGPSPALCEGLGEQITPMGGLPKTHFVVIHPPIGLATADVYGRYFKKQAKRSSAPLPLNTYPHRLGSSLCNDLQPAAEELTPWIGRIKRVFANLDLAGHQMSGSGTAYFGICRSASHARRIAGYLRNQNLGDIFLARSQIANRGSHHHLAQESSHKGY